MALKFRYPDKPVETDLRFFERLTPKQLSMWIANRKYDGWRMPTYIESNIARCMSSTGNSILKMYKGKMPVDLESSFLTLGVPNNTVFDCEFVGLRGSCIPTIYIFDCLAWSGQWLTKVPYEIRWQKCLDLIGRLPENGLIHLAETIYPNVDDRHNIIIAEFNALRQEWYDQGGGKDFLYEGLVVKRRAGQLRLSPSKCEKSPHMFKVKFRDIGETRN